MHSVRLMFASRWRSSRATQPTYEAVLNHPAARPADRLKATELLEACKTRCKNYRRHTMAKELFGIGRKEANRAACEKYVANCRNI